MPQTQTFYTDNEMDTASIGAQIAQQLLFPACVYLQGELGAGKTTLSKSIIQSLGYEGAVTSPTYNIIQEYEVSAGIIYHMDLYRLQDPAELEYLALADLCSNNSLFLIEWPSHGEGLLMPASHLIEIIKGVQEAQRVITFSEL